MTATNWQPYLIGSRLRLRPLIEGDFNSLFSAASDPLIWEQHPDRLRHSRERFEVYFRSAMDCGRALAVFDLQTGEIIGCSRYVDPTASSVEISHSFLTRAYWGGEHNRELKSLMLDFAYQSVETVYFVVNRTNLRSRKAMKKIGGIEITDLSSGPIPRDISQSVVFRIMKSEWPNHTCNMAFNQLPLSTSRLTLEPIDENHAEELWELFRDPELHHFVPFEPISVEKQRERCAKWAKRRSPDGTEIWFNWAAREKTTGRIMAHLQAGIKQDGVASIGYVVAREFQNKGFATEGLEAVFTYLNSLGVREAKAWSDTRNTVSHRLAKRLGMTQVDFIKDADFFKGATSDEFVFSKVFQ